MNNVVIQERERCDDIYQFSNCHAKKKEAGKPPNFTLLDKLLYLTGRALSPTIGGEGDVGIAYG